MNIAQIETKVQQLLRSFQPETFIYELLLAYGMPKASIKRLQLGGLNLSKEPDEIVWKKNLFFKSTNSVELEDILTEMKNSPIEKKHDPRFIILTNFKQILAFDTKTKDALNISVDELAKHFDFFLPWAGMEKAQHQHENPADVKAAEKMAKLYDDIRKDNPTETPEEVHNLNVFLSRLLFCYFAEDTGIFEPGLFTKSISSHTQVDGSDLGNYLDTLFEVMNTSPEVRKDLPEYLNVFPYVNGGLFRKKHTAPVFSRKSRQLVIESGELDWSAINPDIFGSMIQAVITPEHRGGMGMHYTSVPNIMKVIEPLFLDELKEELNASQGNPKKLQALLHRIWNIKIFDPACGSGNFLIIAYKELRKLEMEIFKAMGSMALSNIRLSNFYGIELDDFAHEVAILSLWLAEHQMNQLFLKEFGRAKPALPLQETGNIVHGNACRLDWEAVCPKEENDEIYILGNPPYLGSSMQNKSQKEDMAIVFKEFNDYKNLDYIACWFYKGAKFLNSTNGQVAFVSTNSICQGEQVALLWPIIFSMKLEFGFAHTSFKWTNNAKSKAAVIVVIIGIRKKSLKQKVIFKDGIRQFVYNINAYLLPLSNIILSRRSNPISKFPDLVRGSMPTDDGNFTLSLEEKQYLTEHFPESKKFLKKYLSGGDFLNDKIRYCLWIEDIHLSEAEKIPFIKNRLDAIREFRLKSDAPSTVEYAKFPNRFRQIAYKESDCIVIPLTSSIRRKYIPFSFLGPGTVVTNSAGVIYDAEVWLFGVISSRIHMNWVEVVAGRLKTDYRYSSVICYNNFPFPPISEAQKKELEKHVYAVLGAREAHSEKTLAQLYDPDKMPANLREAHHELDLAVERCYRAKPFESDEERLEYLFKLYEKMIEEENNSGTLFAKNPKPKKRK